MNKLGVIGIAVLNIFSALAGMGKKEKREVTILLSTIPSYTHDRWYSRNLEIVFRERYQNYRIIYPGQERYRQQTVQEHDTLSHSSSHITGTSQSHQEELHTDDNHR